MPFLPSQSSIRFVLEVSYLSIYETLRTKQNEIAFGAEDLNVAARLFFDIRKKHSFQKLKNCKH
jgi:hypothetical protein